jgi:fatty acid desaturase
MYFDRELWRFTRGHRAQLMLCVAAGLAAIAAGLARLALFGWLVTLALRGAPADAFVLPVARRARGDRPARPVRAMARRATRIARRPPSSCACGRRSTTASWPSARPTSRRRAPAMWA